MSLVRQQVAPAAFEIRFSRTDAGLEVFEIQSDLDSQERVPDPFKKRDKIPRNSGSHMNPEQNFNNSNINNTAPLRHSSTDSSTIVKKSKHYDNNLNNVSNQAKSKSSNAVGPEADKTLQRANVAGKNLLGSNNNDMGMTANSTLERKNLSEDDSMIRSVQFNSKKRPFKAEENTSERERDNLGKEMSNYQTMELNGKIEKVIPNNKKNTQKNTLKNKKFNMSTNNYKDEETKLLLKDGIVTPPNTPPRISPLTHSNIPNTSNIPNISNTSNTNTSHTPNMSNITNTADIPTPHTLEESLITPPLSSGGSATFNVDISTVQPTSKPTRLLKESQGTVDTNIPNELRHPRGRRSSSSSRPVESLQESRTPNKPRERESQKSQQSQPVIIKSRIPRLSISSRERPVIYKKESHESLPSQGSNESNEPDELKESQSSKTLQPATSKLEPIRTPRSSKSRPIINTSLSYAEVESESPTSPQTNSPTSPQANSPTSSFNQPKKPVIPHDEVIVPTVAKKLKMNGQLHFANHDALLGYTDESESISPTTEHGYMDVTDQVIDLFDNPQIKKHKRQPSVPDSQHRQKTSTRKDSSAGHSRNSSTHYVAPRKQNHQQLAQHVYEELPSPTSTKFEDSSNSSMIVENSAPSDDIKRNRKSRREEYIMVVRDDDEEEDEDEDVDITEPRSSMSLSPSEPSTAPTTEVESREEYLDNKVNEIINPTPIQIPVVQVEYNPYPIETASVPVPVPTNGKKNKKRNKKQKEEGGDLDEDGYIRKSKCCCIVQ